LVPGPGKGGRLDVGLTSVKRELLRGLREALDNINSRIRKKYRMKDSMEEDLLEDYD
jgi:hypothetical protein